MYKLSNNRYEMEVYINNLPLSEMGGIMLTNLMIYEDLCDPVASCKMTISVPFEWLDGHIIADGVPIKVKIQSKDFKLNETYDFRLLNITQLNQSQGLLTLVIEGLLDFYDIYSHPNEFNLYGRSSDVFKKVASTFNLISEIDNTNDIQLWCAGHRSIYDFFNYLTSYGWKDDTSAMIWTIDRHKILLYKDIANLFYGKSNKIYTFEQSQVPLENKYTYTSISGEVLCGKNNFQNNGYGASNTFNFDLLDYEYKRTSSEVVRASSKFINLNKELVKGLDQDWCVFNVGNVNKNYYKAYLQNKRILSTYSTYMTLKSNFLEQYRLGQIVNVDYSDGRNKKAVVKSLSGTCMISSIVIALTPTTVSCEIGTMIQGFNTGILGK